MWRLHLIAPRLAILVALASAIGFIPAIVASSRTLLIACGIAMLCALCELSHWLVHTGDGVPAALRMTALLPGSLAASLVEHRMMARRWAEFESAFREYAAHTSVTERGPDEHPDDFV